MAIVTVGIDLAKNVFAVHGVDSSGNAVLIRPHVPRAKLLELIASLPPCLIGMEACSGAHHWVRQFATFGHSVRWMAPKFVAPYRLSGKRGKKIVSTVGNGHDFSCGRQFCLRVCGNQSSNSDHF
ncbi:transposase [Candidatus Symbiobacter mobilis CR]|uniref:Transposase n=1 Tax=Candidatus Symbiobacter mobilis CR TaxID=946483 RepID=U5N7E4_9BURK|nr:transposase [Candidatus Symbiobacter mobilis CR]